MRADLTLIDGLAFNGTTGLLTRLLVDLFWEPASANVPVRIREELVDPAVIDPNTGAPVVIERKIHRVMIGPNIDPGALLPLIDLQRHKFAFAISPAAIAEIEKFCGDRVDARTARKANDDAAEAAREQQNQQVLDVLAQRKAAKESSEDAALNAKIQAAVAAALAARGLQ
jgi:hypothetical protein